MAHVLDIARYVLERQGALSTLKLQKLVYYAQVWAITDGEPLFSDAVKAWAQGPVVPALFHAHKGRRTVGVGELGVRAPASLTAREIEQIDRVLAHYGALPGEYLSKLTHAELPWRQARQDGLQNHERSPAISVAAIRDFYLGRTPAELENDYQMEVARALMDEHAPCLARLAQ